MAVTNAVSWRTEGIRYRKNEVFLDVIESVNLLVRILSLIVTVPCRYTFHMQVNSNGNVVRSEILGAVKMKCYLSGMPELRLGLNDKVMFENTGRSTFRQSSSPSSPYLTCTRSQHPGVRPSRWRMSNSTNASVFPALKTTVPYRLYRPMANLNSCPTGFPHP